MLKRIRIFRQGCDKIQWKVFPDSDLAFSLLQCWAHSTILLTRPITILLLFSCSYPSKLPPPQHTRKGGEPINLESTPGHDSLSFFPISLCSNKEYYSKHLQNISPASRVLKNKTSISKQGSKLWVYLYLFEGTGRGVIWSRVKKTVMY